MHNAVNAILSGQEQSARCSEALQSAGFPNDDISILKPDPKGAEELGFQRRSKAAGGFAAGAIFGGILGAECGYFAFILPGTVPDLAIFTNPQASAAMSIAAMLGLAAALVGAVIGALIPEFVVCKYDRKNRIRNILLSVHVDNPKEQRIAERVLRYEGAQEVALAEEDERPRADPLAAAK